MKATNQPFNRVSVLWMKGIYAPSMLIIDSTRYQHIYSEKKKTTTTLIALSFTTHITENEPLFGGL